MDPLVSKDTIVEINRLQQRLYEKGVPVILLFEGDDGNILQRTINEILRCMEPRGITYFNTDLSVPGSKPIFDCLSAAPADGSITLYDRSWYSAMISRYEGRDGEYDRMVDTCNSLERFLCENGTYIIKILLDAGADRQWVDADPLPIVSSFLTRDTLDPVKFRLTMSDGFMKRTDTDLCPWNVVKVTDEKDTISKVFSIMIKRFEQRLDDYGPKFHKLKGRSYPNPRRDMDLNVQCPDYYDLIEQLSARMAYLQSVLAVSGRSVVICFEGWDAAGKGSAIKHLVHAMNPRGYTVKQVKAPTKVEAEHDYMWRFVRSMPHAGHVTVFDRTWYGRMLVEPIEGFCTEYEYERSAEEINLIEKMMADDGIILFKFWLDISPEEQLKRFEKRRDDPLKSWKLTDEDWRNRDKWDIYDKYVDAMIERTNTPDAPWTVVPADNKKHSRVTVLSTVVERLDRILLGRE